MYTAQARSMCLIMCLKFRELSVFIHHGLSKNKWLWSLPVSRNEIWNFHVRWTSHTPCPPPFPSNNNLWVRLSDRGFLTRPSKPGTPPCPPSLRTKTNLLKTRRRIKLFISYLMNGLYVLVASISNTRKSSCVPESRRNSLSS